MFITGPEGSGKTYEGTAVLAAMLPDAIVNQGSVAVVYEFSAAWISVPKLLTELRDVFRSKDRTESGILERYIKCKVLVLDDLGAEKSTDFTSQAIYTLISERINWMRTTIVTSNLSVEEIHRGDPRLASRLGGMWQIVMEYSDWRQKEA